MSCSAKPAASARRSRLPRFLASFSLATMLCSPLYFPAHAADALPARDVALARDYVFAACVIARYPDTPLAAEAEAWAGGLVERGHLAAEAYPVLAQLARRAPEPGATSTGVAMTLQSCFDFVNARGFIDRLRSELRHSTR